MLNAVPTDIIPSSPSISASEVRRKTATSTDLEEEQVAASSKDVPPPLPEVPPPAVNAMESLGIVASGMYRSSRTAVTTLFVKNDNRSTVNESSSSPSVSKSSDSGSLNLDL